MSVSVGVCAPTLVKMPKKVLSNFRHFVTEMMLHVVISGSILRTRCQFMKESFTTPDLDRIDVRILRRLQRDGRTTNADLARAVHISPATCHRRTQRLFDEGYIRAVRADISPARVERGTLVIVGVVLDRSTQESFSAFEAATRKLPFVLDCHLVAGDFDFFLKIRVKDIADFRRLHGEQLLALPGVRQTRTFFVMKEVVDNAPLDF